MKRLKNKNTVRNQDEKSVGSVRVLSSGIVILALAFLLLRFANPQGDNFAAHASPFVFIFSWALILAGILWEEKGEPR